MSDEFDDRRVGGGEPGPVTRRLRSTPVSFAPSYE